MIGQAAKVHNLDYLRITLITFANRNASFFWKKLEFELFSRGISNLKHKLLLHLETDRKRSWKEKRKEHPLRQESHILNTGLIMERSISYKIQKTFKPPGVMGAWVCPAICGKGSAVSSFGLLLFGYGSCPHSSFIGGWDRRFRCALEKGRIWISSGWRSSALWQDTERKRNVKEIFKIFPVETKESLWKILFASLMEGMGT